MSRTYWTIYYQASGGSWQSDGSIPRPNADWVNSYVGAHTTVILADGSKAFVTPETRYRTETIVFMWYADDGTYKSKIEDYVKNHDLVKFTSHLGTVYTGKFVGIKSSHLIGQEDTWDLEATFEPTSVA